MDTITITLMVIIFFIFTVVGYNIYQELDLGFEQGGDLRPENQQIIDDLETYYPPMFDSVMVFLMFMFTIGAIISAFLVDTHPTFFILSIILLIIVFVIAASLGGAVTEIALEFATLSEFPISFWIFSNLLTVVIIDAFLIGLALYAKMRYF